MNNTGETVFEDLEKQIRSAESFLFFKEIQKSFGLLDGIIQWAKSEMIGEWRWQLVEVSTDTKPGRYIFYFDNERDCVAFTIKWS